MSGAVSLGLENLITDGKGLSLPESQFPHTKFTWPQGLPVSLVESPGKKERRNLCSVSFRIQNAPAPSTSHVPSLSFEITA